MTALVSWIALVVIGGSGVGCGPEATGASLACMYVSSDASLPGVAHGSFCAEYSGAVVPDVCPTAASYSPVMACPEEGRVARCDIVLSTTTGESVSALYTYEQAPNALEVARTTCEDASGTLTEL